MISTLFDLRAVKTAILYSWLFSTIYSTRQSSRSYKFIIPTAELNRTSFRHVKVVYW